MLPRCVAVLDWQWLLLWICLFPTNKRQDHSAWIFSKGMLSFKLVLFLLQVHFQSLGRCMEPSESVNKRLKLLCICQCLCYYFRQCKATWIFIDVNLLASLTIFLLHTYICKKYGSTLSFFLPSMLGRQHKLPSAEASKWVQCTSQGQYTPCIKGIVKTP